jgi:hypothetical protein
MQVHGVSQILTFNDWDFTRYSGNEAVHPRSITARLYPES